MASAAALKADQSDSPRRRGGRPEKSADVKNKSPPPSSRSKVRCRNIYTGDLRYAKFKKLGEAHDGRGWPRPQAHMHISIYVASCWAGTFSLMLDA